MIHVLIKWDKWVVVHHEESVDGHVVLCDEDSPRFHECSCKLMCTYRVCCCISVVVSLLLSLLLYLSSPSQVRSRSKRYPLTMGEGLDTTTIERAHAALDQLKYLDEAGNTHDSSGNKEIGIKSTSSLTKTRLCRPWSRDDLMRRYYCFSLIRNYDD